MQIGFTYVQYNILQKNTKCYDILKQELGR